MQTSQPPLSGSIPVPETAEDALMSLMMALGRRLRQRQPGDQIDYSAFPILKLLSHQGPLRLSAVASVLGLDASTVSRHAKQLEDRGLLARTGDPDDGRASRVAVSERGAECLAAGFANRRTMLAQALEDWSVEDRDELRTLLHRVVQKLLVLPEPHPHDTHPNQTQESSA